MSATTTNIFISGATGLLGGSVLARLLSHPAAHTFAITALVRSSEKGDKLKTLGVSDIVVGSYTAEDLSFLTDAVAQADVVFTLVDSDNLPAAQAVLKGLKIKYERSGKAPILIHASGTAIIMDNSLGLTSEHMTYSDLDIDKLNALPETALHRNVDIPIIKADEEGYVKAYLATPGTIFGLPSGPLVDLGIQNTHSMQVPFIVRPSIARKAGGYINKGLNTWSAVSLEDTVDLVLLIFDNARSSNSTAGHGREGYYFAENLTYSGIELARAVSEALFALGVAESKEPKAFEQAELDAIFGPIWPFLATNCYAKADRSRALGWRPKSTKEDFLEDVKREVGVFLENPKAGVNVTSSLM